MNEELFKCQASAAQKIQWLLDMESVSFATLNDHYYKDYREKFLNSYRDARFPPTLQYSKPREELIAQDPYSQALHHMASARGYFQGWC